MVSEPGEGGRMAYQFRKIERKYKNTPIEVNGYKFASKKEANRYKTLQAMVELGVISDLRLQQKFVLIPSQRIDGKLVERECSYKADFVYIDNETGKTVVEDTKGFRTKDYVIKRKLMLQKFGIKIKEL